MPHPALRNARCPGRVPALARSWNGYREAGCMHHFALLLSPDGWIYFGGNERHSPQGMWVKMITRPNASTANDRYSQIFANYFMKHQ
jgi:hypothetical protein